MSFEINTPNMLLPVPAVGQTAGPQYATDINNSLTIIDQHNHSTGSGVQITPSGLNLNSDLTFLSNNAIGLRSTRYIPQTSAIALPTDLGCLFVAGVDLYFNDVNGNHVRLTQGGSIIGTAGSISGLPSGTASAAYAVGTFTFQSATSTSANIDAGSYILRNNIANSKGLTLQPPNAMGANYSVTLPSLPAQTSFVTMDTSGNMGSSVAFPLVGSNLVNNSVTRAQLAAVGQQVSPAASSGVPFTTSSTSPQTVSYLTVTLTTSGRPVVIGVMPTQIAAGGGYGGGGGAFQFNDPNLLGGIGAVYLYRNGTLIASYDVGASFQTPQRFVNLPVSSCSSFDTQVAGTYTYTVSIATRVNNGGCTITAPDCQIYAYEL